MSEPTKLVFSKSLTPTDANKSLAIPSDSLRELPEFNGRHTMEITLMYKMKPWRIACSVSKTGYKKPVFSRGWRYFAKCNDLCVGDQLTLYKDCGSSHYTVELHKRATRPSEDLLPPAALSVNHEVDETTGTSRRKFNDFKLDKKQLPMADSAPVEEEGAIMDPANLTVIVPFVDYVSAKSPNTIFGTSRSGEATVKARFKNEHEPQIKISGTLVSINTGMGEAFQAYMTTKPFDLNVDGGSQDDDTGHAAADNGNPFHAYYKTKPFDLNVDVDVDVDGDSPVDGASHAAAGASYKSMERFSLDLVPPQSTPYEGEMNLVLTLAQPIVDISSI